jgi:hypothetical protein
MNSSFRFHPDRLVRNPDVRRLFLLAPAGEPLPPEEDDPSDRDWPLWGGYRFTPRTEELKIVMLDNLYVAHSRGVPLVLTDIAQMPRFRTREVARLLDFLDLAGLIATRRAPIFWDADPNNGRLLEVHPTERLFDVFERVTKYLNMDPHAEHSDHGFGNAQTWFEEKT